MADTKISALTASTTPLAGTEVLPIVQSGVTKQVSVANLTAGRAISATQMTLTTGNLIVASGQGIDFSATPGTGTSELLSDYEEGTWTPTDASGAGLTFTNDGAYYVKVGSLVVATFAVIYPATVSTAGASIGGLPFQSQNTGAATYSVIPSFTTYATPFLGVVGVAAFSMFFTLYGGASVTNANFSGQYVRCTAVYRVL